MLEDPVFSLKRRWEHNFSCYYSQKTVLSEHRGQLLWTVHCTATLAKCSVWAKAFSLFRVWAAEYHYVAFQRVLEVHFQLSEVQLCLKYGLLQQGGLALHLLCFPLSQSSLLVSHSHVPEFSPSHTALPVFVCWQKDPAGVVVRVYQGFWGCQCICSLSLVCWAPVLCKFLSSALDGEVRLISNTICLCHS